MVAALQTPPEEYLTRRDAPGRVVRARVIPLHRGNDQPVPVHRQPSPRVTRSHGAAVYWRRRLVAAALGLGVLLTAAHAGAALGGTTTTAPERSPHVERIVVQPGDTLWSIAERLAPNSDPRGVVDQLSSALGTSSVQPGEVIRWPQ